ncbi:MAG: hypothetical protein DRJ02_05060, partial [Bacteroidetes bacterium]
NIQYGKWSPEEYTRSIRNLKLCKISRFYTGNRLTGFKRENKGGVIKPLIIIELKILEVFH